MRRYNIKIYWHSTAPWGGSSYSVLTKRTVPDLVRMGYEVCLGTWYGLQGENQTWTIKKRGDPNGPAVGTVPILPYLNPNAYGTDTMLASYEQFKADVCIAVMDVWVIPPSLSSRMRFAPWFPIDHDPAPTPVVHALSTAIYPMSYSKWGVEVLERAGIEAHYVPCSVESAAYRPMPRAEAREKLGIPDKVGFMVSMIAANKDPQDRKGFGEGLQGFAKFMQSHEDAYLYIHTNWSGPIEINHMCCSLGIADHVVRHDQLQYMMGGYKDDYMRWVYNASDVLLNPAKSEGFGLPILEAQMCGCPVAATDFSTTNELVKTGWKITGQRHWSPGADSWRLLANVDSVAAALEDAYRAKDNKTLRKATRQSVIEYDTELVAKKYWAPALKEIEGLVTGGELKLVTF